MTSLRLELEYAVAGIPAPPLGEFIDPVDFQWVYDTHQNIHGKKVKYEEYNLSTLQNIVYIEKEDVVLATNTSGMSITEIAKAVKCPSASPGCTGSTRPT